MHGTLRDKRRPVLRFWVITVAQPDGRVRHYVADRFARQDRQPGLLCSYESYGAAKEHCDDANGL